MDPLRQKGFRLLDPDIAEIIGKEQTCFLLEKLSKIRGAHIELLGHGFKGNVDNPYPGAGAPLLHPVKTWNLSSVFWIGVRAQALAVYTRSVMNGPLYKTLPALGGILSFSPSFINFRYPCFTNLAMI
jgi:hypothetical protein